MAKRKKKNAITLVSLLLALVVLVGFYVWYSNRKTEKDSTTDTQTISLATVDTSKVTAIHYTGSDIDMNFVLEDGIWKSKEEPDRPINQDNVNSLLSTIGTITAYQELKTHDDLAEYGLDNPKTYIQATLKDGSTVTLRLGSEVVTGQGNYALVNDDTKVYLVDVSYSSGLSFTNLDMTEIEKAPEITAANINDISIDNRDSNDVELKLNEDGGLDNSGTNLYTWEILKPYGKGYSADSSKISSLQANYASFDFIDCIDYKGDDLSKYGLDNPAATIDIGYYEAQATTSPTPTTSASDSTAKKISKEYKIYIGNKNDDGDYYVRSDGSNAVYTMSGSTVDTMLTVDVFSLINPYVSIPNIDIVDKISADIEGTPYSMEIKRTSSSKDDSSAETTATYYYNGDKVKEDLFKSVYQTIVSAKYDAVLKDKVDTAKLKPFMTLSFHIFGDNETTIATSFLPYNDSFYIADKGSGVYFLVDKRSVDAMAKAIKTFSGSKE